MKFLLFQLFAALCVGLELRRDVSDMDSATAAWMAAARADQEFLVTSWQKLAGELQQLKAATYVAPSNRTSTHATEKEVATPATPTSHTSVHAIENKKVAKVATEKKKADVEKVLAATKGLKGKAMLAPMEGMLKGLYEDQKARITDANKHEEESKKRFVDEQKRHNVSLAHYKDQLEHHNMKKAQYDEFIKLQDRQFKYWSGVRERQHRQFHTQLKLMHGLMAKEKGMIKAYDTALSNKSPTKAGAKQALDIGHQVAPDIMLIQTSELNEYVSHALVVADAQLEALGDSK